MKLRFSLPGSTEVMEAAGEIVNDMHEAYARLAAEDDSDDELVVAPGLVDVHVHLREPGLQQQLDSAENARFPVAGGDLLQPPAG